MSEKIALGAVLHGSWGYDQTNPEFYKVVKVSPSGKSAWLVSCGYKMVPGDGDACSNMAGHCVPGEPPADGKVYGPVRLRQNGCWCNEPKYGHCGLSVWNGRPCYVSWYA